MSHNPYQKLIPSPKTIPDPKTITIDNLAKYHSIEMQKINYSWFVHKKSFLYLGGCVGLMLVAAYIGEKTARKNLFGSNNQGGRYLDLRTHIDEAHYAYNRQFQRMMVLAQGAVPDVSNNSSQLLADLGVKVNNYGSTHIPKKAPHEKYY